MATGEDGRQAAGCPFVATGRRGAFGVAAWGCLRASSQSPQTRVIGSFTRKTALMRAGRQVHPRFLPGFRDPQYGILFLGYKVGPSERKVDRLR
jgi:hypothetical protein